MSDTGALEARLKRDISKLGFAAMTVNGVIGAGIFGLPAVAAAQAGDFSPWMFVICGALTLTIVLSFARASSLVRETGGPIVYASHAFGPFLGFQTGFLAWLSRIASMGANSNLMVTYAAWFWPPLDSEPWRSLALSTIIGSFTWLNVVGVRSGIATVYVFTVLKLLPLSLLILFGLGHIDVGRLLGADVPALDGFGETVLVLLYAFVGFEGTVVPAGEGRNPRRDLPGALIQTTLIITVVYVLVQLVSMGALPDLAGSDTALADAAAVLIGSAGAALLTFGAVASIGGNLLASLLSAPRMTWALARDGLLPSWFATIHPRHSTPHHSIWVYGVVSLVLALTGSFVWLAAMSTLVRLVTYMVCIAALPRLARRAREDAEPATDQPFELPGGLLIPALAMVLCLWLVAQASLRSWLVLLGFVAAGSNVYVLTKRQSS